MKGKLLSYEEIKNLKDGTKIWYDGVFYNCLAIINDNKLFDVVTDECLIYVSDLKNDTEGREVYEWIEIENIRITTKEDIQPKTYKGSEILAMIEDGKLKDDDYITDREGNQWQVEHLKKAEDYEIVCSVLLEYAPFTIKQKPVDFMIAVNSNKNIRPVSLNQEKKFHPYTYWLGYMVSSMAYKENPLDLMNRLWEVEQ